MRRRLTVALAAAALMVAGLAGSVSAAGYQDPYGGYGYGGYSNPNYGYTHGYSRSNGTYVSGYYHTMPNSRVTDNYSYRGNYNPWTSSYGTRSYGSHSSIWGR
jgi:hypothetical protein